MPKSGLKRVLNSYKGLRGPRALYSKQSLISCCNRGEYILVISNVITLATLIIAIGLYFKYRAQGPLRPL